MKKGPQYHSAHRKEEKSKRDFEALIEPCVVNWSQRDYGLDGMVTLFLDDQLNGSVELDSIHFLIQLKSTTRVSIDNNAFSFAIETNKIKDYVKSNVSVLLVVCNLNSGDFYSRWMDNELIGSLAHANPDWISKKKVSIRFLSSDRLNKPFVNSFKAYLLSRKRNMVAILPGQYFALRDQVKSLLDDFKKITSPFGFESSERTLDILYQKIDQAIYRIAVAGPSRAGKSTLINALLKKNISPIGIYQTTGVPIQVIPGIKNEVTVYFKDNTKITENFSLELITDYVAQSGDLSRIRNVKLVSVSIVNSALERGVSMFDVPGLDDPDDEILAHALSYVKTFNAIIYLIDVSPHKAGGFAFKAEFKHQLQQMTSQLDKVFLVFNKIDSLTETELESLTKRVDYDLKRLGLADKVDSKISYISAQKSFEVTLSGRSFSNDPLAILEKDIWTYLLEGDKAGIYRLLDVTHQVYKAYNDFSTILNTRLLDSAKLEELYSAIEEIKEKLPELRQMFESKGNSTLEKMKLFLDAEKHQLLWRLDKRLKTIPVDKAFPGDSDIKQYLISEIDAMIVRANQLCMQQVNLYKNDVDVWIEGNLKRLRGIINNNTQTQFMDLSPIETMIIPTIDFSAAFGMGILGGIIAVLINPYAAVGTVVATAAATFFGLLFFTAETRRAKRIVKVIESTRSRCDTVFEDIESKFSHGIREIFITIHNYTNERISLYFSDLSSQINKINTHRLSEEERELYKRCFNLLKEQESRLEKTVNELSRFK